MGKIIAAIFYLCIALMSGNVAIAREAQGEVTLSPTRHGDDGRAIQTAIVSRCKDNGGKITLAPGIYHLQSSITVLCALTIVGSGWRESPQENKMMGTWLSIEQDKLPSISFVVGSKGSSISDIAFIEPEQRLPTRKDEWHPVVMPPAISIRNVGGRTYIHNIYMQAVDRGIESLQGGRTDIDGLFGQFFDNAISLDDEQDVSSIKNVHSWPYATVDTAVIDYQQSHLNTIIMGRVDSAFVDEVFTYAAHSGVWFVKGRNNAVATGIQIGKLQCDSVAHCIDIAASGVTVMVGEMRQFGQRGIASNQPFENSDAIRVSGQASILAGMLEARMVDKAVLTLENRHECSNLRISSLFVDFSHSKAQNPVITRASSCGSSDKFHEVLFGMRPAIISQDLRH